MKKMKKIFNSLFVMVISTIVVSANAQEFNYPEGIDNCTVELNGDSLLFGYVNNPNIKYKLSVSPAQWLQKNGFSVVDKSAAGVAMYDIVRGYQEPFFNAPLEYYPAGSQPAFNNALHDSKIVVLQAGVNDYPNPNLRQLYIDYSWAVDHIRYLGKIPVITGISQISPFVTNTETYNKVSQIRELVRQVAIDKRVHYASYDTVPVDWTDGIHLNQDSSNGVTENLRYVLSVICKIPY